MVGYSKCNKVYCNRLTDVWRLVQCCLFLLFYCYNYYYWYRKHSNTSYSIIVTVHCGDVVLHISLSVAQDLLRLRTFYILEYKKCFVKFWRALKNEVGLEIRQK